jgi:hypothetical protein
MGAVQSAVEDAVHWVEDKVVNPAVEWVTDVAGSVTNVVGVAGSWIEDRFDEVIEVLNETGAWIEYAYEEAAYAIAPLYDEFVDGAEGFYVGLTKGDKGIADWRAGEEDRQRERDRRQEERDVGRDRRLGRFDNLQVVEAVKTPFGGLETFDVETYPIWEDQVGFRGFKTLESQLVQAQMINDQFEAERMRNVGEYLRAHPDAEIEDFDRPIEREYVARYLEGLETARIDEYETLKRVTGNGWFGVPNPDLTLVRMLQVGGYGNDRVYW